MTLHLLKMAVGIAGVDHLRRRQSDRLVSPANPAAPDHVPHFTRNTPKRAQDLLNGGSIYWVIRGQIRARQAILGVTRQADGEGRPYCELQLDPELVRTTPRRQRPIQGWRYLEPAEAPPDLDAATADHADMPPEMLAELRALGLL